MLSISIFGIDFRWSKNKTAVSGLEVYRKLRKSWFKVFWGIYFYAFPDDNKYQLILLFDYLFPSYHPTGLDVPRDQNLELLFLSLPGTAKWKLFLCLAAAATAAA